MDLPIQHNQFYKVRRQMEFYAFFFFFCVLIVEMQVELVGMQAICGKVRLIGRQAANILKNADTGTVRNSPAINIGNGFDCLWRSSSVLGSSPLLMLVS